jgi:hypothetical protein
VVYFKKINKNCYMGSTRNWRLYSVLGNSKDRSAMRVTQAVACDRSAVRATQAVACDRSAPLALGIKLSLWPPAFLPPHFKTYITVKNYCRCLVCFPHPWAGHSQVTKEITQMASVHLKIPLQESMLTLTGARLPGDSIPCEEQSETEFRTRNRQTFCEMSQLK